MMEQIRIARITQTGLRIQISREVHDHTVAFARRNGEWYVRVRILDQRRRHWRRLEVFHLARMGPDDLGVRKQEIMLLRDRLFARRESESQSFGKSGLPFDECSSASLNPNR